MVGSSSINISNFFIKECTTFGYSFVIVAILPSNVGISDHPCSVFNCLKNKSKAVCSYGIVNEF